MKKLFIKLITFVLVLLTIGFPFNISTTKPIVHFGGQKIYAITQNQIDISVTKINCSSASRMYIEYVSSNTARIVAEIYLQASGYPNAQFDNTDLRLWFYYNSNWADTGYYGSWILNSNYHKWVSNTFMIGTNRQISIATNSAFIPAQITDTWSQGPYTKGISGFFINEQTIAVPDEWMNKEPEINILMPLAYTSFTESDTSFIPQISIYDSNNDTISCKYYIDSETTARDTKTVSSTTTAQTVSFSPLDMSTLTEGSHTMKFEVSDGIASPVIQTVNFRVDKSAPTIGTVSVSSTTNSITVTGTAADSIAGLDALPYRYTIGPNISSWVNTAAYTQDSLVPNTQYPITFEARDAKGHIGSSSKSMYTKAEVPTISANNASSYSLDIVDNGGNPAGTPYQIKVNNGVYYVTPEGTLTTSPVWTALPANKTITVTGLNPDTAYSFQARAKNAEGTETVWGDAVTGTTLVAPPGSPAGITATATNNSITVLWEPVEGALSYDIEVDNTVIDAGANTSYIHAGLNPSTEHKYRIRARNPGGAGNWSGYITKSTLPNPPDTPSNLAATPGSSTVTVTWNSVPYATAYEIEVDGETVSNGAGTSYIHSGLTAGTHHIYRVRAISSGGKSAWSAEAGATTVFETLPVPANLEATPSKNQIVLTWDIMANVAYDIEVDGISIDTGNRNTYTHTGLPAGTSHSYRVRAKKAGITSDWSSTVAVSTLPDAFGIPVNLKADASNISVALTWEGVSGAGSYEIEMDGVVIDAADKPSCTIDGLTPGSLHTFRVKAVSGEVSSDWTIPLDVTLFTLPAPVDITAELAETSIAFTWAAVEGAAGYDIEADGVVAENIIDTCYVLGNLAKNTQHTFRVRAKSQESVSSWSKLITRTTTYSGYNVPSDIFAVVKENSIKVLWKAVTDASAYDIEVDGTLVEDIEGTSYVHESLIPGTQHTYRVRSKQGTAASDFSSILAVSTLPILPAEPANLAAASTSTSIKVTWDAIDNAAEYEIEADGQLIDNGTGTTFIHDGLFPETIHTYRVRAKNRSGTGGWSQVCAASTKSSTSTFVLDCMNNEVFNLLLTATDIKDIGKYTFTVTYDPAELELVDLCGTTPRLDTGTGYIPGTDIKVIQVTPGSIVLVKTGMGNPGQSWTGIVDSVKFKAKVGGQVTITYSVQ